MQRALILLLLAIPLLVSSQNERSLSPYFIVNVDSGETVPDFPLRSTSADVTISGVIADVTVTQVYTNHSSRVLEAIYVFPGSTNAAVYAMEMQIGRRVIEAQVMQKDSARKKYENAKQEGRTTSLLEQQRPNVFTMNVANVMPGDSVIVRMSYTERLLPTEGVYEFVYPTVVAPRYSGEGAPVAGVGNINAPAAEEIPYTKKGIKPSYDFGINVSIASGIPFEFIKSTTHKTLLSFESVNEATVMLDTSEVTGGNRDYILQYRFAGGKIETGLMLYEGKDESFFMLMMEPPKRIPLDSIPPREYIFVMDVSGSMGGYPIETSKQLMRNLLSGLRLSDKFNVIQFAGGGAQMSAQSLDATAENIDSAIAFVNKVQAGGGTELNNAMRMAMLIPQQEGYARSIVIVTDGLISAESKVLQSMRNHLDSANVFAFGIGSSCNRYLIEAMAYCGNGEPTVVTKSTEADSAAERFRQYISSPVLSDIRISYEGFDAYDVEPVAVPDLFASRPLIITGKYRGDARGKISVSGMTGVGPYQKVISVDSVKPRKKNKAIRLLWARDRIKYLSYLDNPYGNNYYGYSVDGMDVRKEITELGLKYNLLTNYTSFIAVDRRVRNKNPQADSTVNQPLPLPAGMDNSAVGMNGILQEVSIVSYTSGVDPHVSCCYSVAMCSVVLTRPVFKGGPATIQDPPTAGDFNRFYNGGFVLPVISNYSQPFFTAGASGRMVNLLSAEMLGMYSLGNYRVDGSPVSSPLNTGSIGFNSWSSHRNQLNFSATHYGVQNLYFSNDWNINDRWSALFEISEQWKGVATDRNKDGYEDLFNGANVSLHHRLTYRYNNDSSFLSRNFMNDIFFHSSMLKGGQIAETQYTTFDNALGFYMSPRAFVELREGHYLDLKTGLAVASINQGWGTDRFQTGTTQFTAEADYDWGGSAWLYNVGADGWISSGEERWNTLIYSADHHSAGVHGSIRYDRSNWKLNASMRGEYNDVGGFTVLPSLHVGRTFNDVSFAISGTRYRDVPFAIGQLQPLFFSSRNLIVAPGTGFNQGWDFKVSAVYTRTSVRNFHLSVNYEVILPEHSVVVNVDSDASEIAVYNVTGGPMIHRVLSKLEIAITGRLSAEADYMFTVTPYKYGELVKQQPLLPMNRGFASLTWKDGRSNLHIRMQSCYTGTQRIPQYGWTNDYMTFNLLMKYEMKNDRITVFANAFNILDYRQRQFLMTTNDQFDGWKVWAPITGRTIQAGVNISF